MPFLDICKHVVYHNKIEKSTVNNITPSRGCHKQPSIFLMPYEREISLPTSLTKECPLLTNGTKLPIDLSCTIVTQTISAIPANSSGVLRLKPFPCRRSQHTDRVQLKWHIQVLMFINNWKQLVGIKSVFLVLEKKMITTITKSWTCEFSRKKNDYHNH